MNLTVGKKMLLIGIISVAGLGILAAINFITNRSIHKYSQIEAQRMAEIEIIDETVQAQLTLMLNAMDAIIDKDEGLIEQERMTVINQSVSQIRTNLDKIETYSGTGNEAASVRELKNNFSSLSSGIQEDLVTLIQKGGAAMTRIKNDFISMDDELDRDAAPIEEGLAKIYASVAKEQTEAADLSALQNTQMTLLNQMIQAHGSLMLAAMDAIIDKNEGRIGPDRMKGINENIRFFSDNIEKLAAMSNEPEEAAFIRQIKETFPHLARAVQVDLKRLIEQRAGASLFSQIDDRLDDYGDPIEKALTGLYGSMSKKQVESTALAILRNRQMGLVNDMIKAHGNLMLAAMDSIIDKDEGRVDSDRIKGISSSIGFLSDHLDDLQALADTEEEKRSVRKIQEIFPQHARQIQVDLVTLIEESGREAGTIAREFIQIDDDLDRFGDRVESGLLQLQAAAREEMEKAIAASEKTMSRSMFLGWTSSVLILAALAATLFLISKSITGPITQISQDLGEGSAQVSSASEQVSSASQSLAEGASQQAASIEETSSSMEEMASMTRKNAENAGHADTLMKDVNKVVAGANQSMEALIQSMEDISKASEKTSKIIKTIDEIAFQTNLLALNAAVEAARAGEAGAGFAVVADEVRNLAIRAAEAARNTAELIQGTVEKVDSGSEIVTGTNEAFLKVADSSTKVGSLVAEISEASREQSEGIEQVNNAITEMDKVVQQNAANAEESASASEEMNAQAEQMKEMVGHLVAMINRQAGTSQGNNTRETRPKSQVQPPQKDKKMIGPDREEIRPDQVIPFGEDHHFKDF